LWTHDCPGKYGFLLAVNVLQLIRVTNVDEWTKEDMGVDAIIAIANQVENALWTFLVITAKIIIKYIK
jgi:hypothetical protein